MFTQLAYEPKAVTKLQVPDLKVLSLHVCRALVDVLDFTYKPNLQNFGF